MSNIKHKLYQALAGILTAVVLLTAVDQPKAHAAEVPNVRICRRCESLPCRCRNPYEGDWLFADKGKPKVASILKCNRKQVNISNSNWFRGYSYLYQHFSSNRMELAVSLDLSTVTSGEAGILIAAGADEKDRIFRFTVKKVKAMPDLCFIELQTPRRYLYPSCREYSSQSHTVPVKDCFELKVERYGEAWTFSCDDSVFHVADFGGLARQDNLLWGLESSMDGHTLKFPSVKINAIVHDSERFRDSDGDGLSDQLEQMAGTDLNRKDSDGDGLSDFKELVLSGTDPKAININSEKPGELTAENDLVYTYKDMPVTIDPMKNDFWKSRNELDNESILNKLKSLSRWQLKLIGELNDYPEYKQQYLVETDRLRVGLPKADIYKILKLLKQGIKGFKLTSNGLIKKEDPRLLDCNPFFVYFKLEWVSPPSKGFAFINGRSVIYIPFAGAVGTDQFSYGISFGDHSSATGIVKIRTYDKLYFINNKGLFSTDSQQNRQYRVLNYDSPSRYLSFITGGGLGVQWVKTPADNGYFYIDNFKQDRRLKLHKNGEVYLSGKSDNSRSCQWKFRPKSSDLPWGQLICREGDDAILALSCRRISSRWLQGYPFASPFWSFSEALAVNDDSFDAVEGVVTELNVLNNDLISNQDGVAIESVTQPAKGEVRIVGKKLAYIAEEQSSGSYSFTYSAKANGEIKTANVTLNVFKTPKRYISHKGSFGKTLYPSGSGVVLIDSDSLDSPYEWEVPSASSDSFYIQDARGKRLQVLNNEYVELAEEGTVGENLEWTFSKSKGYLINKGTGVKLHAAFETDWKVDFVRQLFSGENARWQIDGILFDYDKDGLSDQYELKNGLNPVNPDSDGDGKPDGLEVQIGTDPLVARQFAGGTGTSSSPFLIASAADFCNMLNSSSDNHYSLVTDIDMSSTAITSCCNWYYRFKGTLKGNGHTIANLKRCRKRSHHSLFGVLSGGSVINCKFHNCERSLSTLSELGALYHNVNFLYDQHCSVAPDSCLGNLSNASAVNCSVTGTISPQVKYGKLIYKGTSLIRDALNTSVTNCHSSMDSMYGGALAQNSSKSTFLNCSASGTVTGMQSHSSYITGNDDFSRLWNLHIEEQKAKLKKRYLQLQKETLLQFTTIINEVKTRPKYRLQVYGAANLIDWGEVSSRAAACLMKERDTVLNSLKHSYDSMSAQLLAMQRSGPTPEQFYQYKLPYCVSTSCYYWDIVITYSRLTGVLIHGGGKTILRPSLSMKMVYHNCQNGVLEKAYIPDLDLKPVGGLVRVAQDTVFDGCKVTGRVNGIYKVGGLVGSASGGKIRNCLTTGNVSSDYDGFQLTLLGASSGSSRVSAGTFVGGLTGYCSAEVSNSYTTAEVSGSESVGGLTGHCRQEVASPGSVQITNCYASGRVSGTKKVGGLVGSFSSTESSPSVLLSDSYALNSELKCQSSSFYNRIAGCSYTGRLSGNYARQDMVTPAGISTGTEAYGQSIAAGDIYLQNTYETTATSWDFKTVWVMPAAAPSLPVLQQKLGWGFIQAFDDKAWAIAGKPLIVPVIEGKAGLPEVVKDIGQNLTIKGIRDISPSRMIRYLSISHDRKHIVFNAPDGCDDIVSLNYTVHNTTSEDSAALTIYTALPKIPEGRVKLTPLTVTTSKNIPVNLPLDQGAYTLGYELADLELLKGTVKGYYPTLTYVPAEDFIGTETFRYRKRHEHGFSTFETITVTVTDGATKVSETVDLELYNRLEP